MDLKLNGNGDIDTSADVPCMIGGNEELFQRAFIALKMKKGSFLYNTSLGSEFSAEDDADTLEAKARAALAHIPEAEVVQISRTGDILTVTVEINGQREELYGIQLQ